MCRLHLDLPQRRDDLLSTPVLASGHLRLLRPRSILSVNPVQSQPVRSIPRWFVLRGGGVSTGGNEDGMVDSIIPFAGLTEARVQIGLALRVDSELQRGSERPVTPSY